MKSDVGAARRRALVPRGSPVPLAMIRTMYDIFLMNDRLLSYVAMMAVSLSTACRPPALVPDAPPIIANAMDAAHFVDSLAAAQSLPGFAVTAAVGNSVVWRHAVGFADVATRSPAATTTQFRIGS